MKSIFGSTAEREAYTRLRSYWEKYVDVFPQMPVRRVLGHEELRTLSLRREDIEYLLKAEFDYVVCRKRGEPVLAIEFDGLCQGYSGNGEYVTNAIPLNDPKRKVKLDSKLRACELLGLPMVVVSFPETDRILESDGTISVLDAVIGEVRTSIATSASVQEHGNELGDLLTAGESEGAEDLVWALEFQSEIENNPIRRESVKMLEKLPVVVGDYMAFLRDREGYVGVRREIHGGVHLSSSRSTRQVLLESSAYVRDLNCRGCSAVNLADCIAQYCLARKALREVGTDPDAWQDLMEYTPWKPWTGKSGA